MIRLAPLALLLLAAPGIAAPIPKEAAKLEAEFDALWDSAGQDHLGRVRLYCRLVQQPDAAVAYLTAHVQPAELSEKEARRLIADLDSKDEATWKRAFRDLVTRDPRLAFPLGDVWTEAKTETQRQRLGWLLVYPRATPDNIPAWVGYRLEPPTEPEGYWQLATLVKGELRTRDRIPSTYPEVEKDRPSDARNGQAVVAVAALERIGTPVARKHLDALTGGYRPARSHQEAVAAVKRLDGGAKPEAILAADLWAAKWDKLAAPTMLNAFFDRPGETVRLFKEKLKPLVLRKADADKLLAKLLGEDLGECRAALRELTTFDLRLAMSVQDAWKRAKTPTQRGRLVEAFTLWSGAEFGDDYDPDKRHKYLDYSYHQPDERLERWHTSEELRAGVRAADLPREFVLGGHRVFENTLATEVRDRWYHEECAIYILDAIGTDDAVAIIKDMATGHPDAGPTKAAKDVLKRRGVK